MSRLILKYCDEESITPNDLMIMFVMGYQIKGFRLTKIDKDNSIDRLKKKEFLNEENKLTTKGMRYITDYSDALTVLEGRGRSATKNVNKAQIESTVNNFIEDYRMLFKNTGKTGAMGDKKGCTERMIKFFTEYPEYAKVDLIMNATKKYIRSLNDYTYLKRAHYFIYKDDKHKNGESMLASYCEETELDKDKVSFSKHDMI